MREKWSDMLNGVKWGRNRTGIVSKGIFKAIANKFLGEILKYWDSKFRFILVFEIKLLI